MSTLHPADKSKALLAYPTGKEAYKAWLDLTEELGMTDAPTKKPSRVQGLSYKLWKARYSPSWYDMVPPSLVRMLTLYHNHPHFVVTSIADYARETSEPITSFDFLPSFKQVQIHTP